MKKRIRIQDTGYRSQRLRLGGFTLIELLVVISIIGILASLALVSFGASQKQTRDAQRKSDLRQYQQLLESHANAHDGFYPERHASAGADARYYPCTDFDGFVFGDCPADVKNGQSVCGTALCSYRYQTVNAPSPCDPGEYCTTRYVLWAALENFTSPNYWVVCSDGKSGLYSGSLTVADGVCPI